MMTSVFRGAALAAPLLAALLPAQNNCIGGLGGQTFELDLEAATGNSEHLGVVMLGAEIFVTARGTAGSTAAPHTVYVFLPDGTLLRQFSQGNLTSSTLQGWRDGATDNRNLLFVSDEGIHVVDPNGNPINVLQSANGTQTIANNPITGQALSVLGTIDAIAYDPNGNGGNGSILVADGADPMLEVDLDGNVLRAFGNISSWSIQGLAITPDGNIWANSSPSRGNLVEIDRTSGLETGRQIQVDRLDNLQGGLSLAPALNGRVAGFDLLEVALGSGAGAVDRLRGFAVQTWPGIPEEPELVSGFDSDPLDAQFKVYDRRYQSMTLNVEDPMPGSRPCVYWINAGADALACGDSTWLGGPFLGLAGAVFTAPFTQPAGQAANLPSLTNTPITLPSTSILGVVPNGALRIQAVVLETRVPTQYFPLIPTNEAEFTLDDTPILGITVEANGSNSFNSDQSSGFFSIDNRSAVPGKAIVRAVFDWAGSPNPGQSTQLFDTDQTGMSDRFDSGNGTLSSCTGTYRNGSDVAAGLIYDAANNPPAGCDPAANTGWIGRNLGSAANSFRTIEFRFASGMFGNGVKFEVDIDTDGGIGTSGGDMQDLVITLDFADGTSQTKLLAFVSDDIANVVF